MHIQMENFFLRVREREKRKYFAITFFQLMKMEKYFLISRKCRERKYARAKMRTDIKENENLLWENSNNEFSL